MNRKLSSLLVACLLAAPLATTIAASAQDTRRVHTREYDQSLRQVREAYEAQDWDRAFRLSSDTARWGDKWSQFALGSLYLDGKGGADENVLLAYGWLAASAESGIPEFVAAAERLHATIPTQYQEEADAVARELITRYGLQATGVTCDKRRPTGSNRRVLDCRKSRALLDEWIEVPAYASTAADDSLAYGERPKNDD